MDKKTVIRDASVTRFIRDGKEVTGKFPEKKEQIKKQEGVKDED